LNTLLFGFTLLLAFANGANDNSKGVATLYGCGGIGYRRALWLGTLSVAAGSLLSVFVAGELVRAFSAKGLVPDGLLDVRFLTAVAAGAAATVLIATRIGMPISTTHALLGALAGAGVVVAGDALDAATLAKGFALPLLLSPLMAVALAAAGVWSGRRIDGKLGPGPAACICVSARGAPVVLATAGGVAVRANATASGLQVEIGTAATCPVHADVALSRRQLDRAVETGHRMSATLVGFARGLNDTPKILGLLVGAAVVAPVTGALWIAAAMALGGLVAARRVTHTMAQRLTRMTPGEGLAGNLATSLLVVGASRIGVPVSTTHVSTGGIFGIGLTNGELRKRAAAQVLLAWMTTLPLAAALAAGAMLLLGR
jgi:PiT family inorganic phosphate transporter